MYRGYPEEALVTNRSSLLLFGGTEAERRAWAEEAARNFEGEGPLRVATTAAELSQALALSRGVVYVPDATALGESAQVIAVHVLHEREERPKIVFGITRPPDLLVAEGRLRMDLHYSLSMAQVNLDEPGLRDAIRVRRARAPKRAAPPPPPPARSPAPAPARAPAPKPRPAARSKPHAAASRRARPAHAKKVRAPKKSAARKRPAKRRR